MWTSMHRLAILLALAPMACAPGAPGGIQYASGEGSVTVDGLHLVQWEPFRTTYVKPGADLQRYTKVAVQEVTVSYKTPPRAGRFEQDEIDPNYALPDSAMVSLKKYFHEAFVKALGASKDLRSWTLLDRTCCSSAAISSTCRSAYHRREIRIRTRR